MEAQALHLFKAEGKEERTGYMAVASGKGGVGKTLITINIGSSFLRIPEACILSFLIELVVSLPTLSRHYRWI